MKLAEIGKKISELRREMNLTQGELAEGICTQALISLIEKGELDPNATVLYQISRKLGVDVNYFFQIGSTPRLDYVREVATQLRRLRINRQHEEMMEIVQVEEHNPLFSNDSRAMQFLYWHKSVYMYEVKGDHDGAISLLEEAMDLVDRKKRAYTENELEMLLTLGAFEFNGEHYDRAMEKYQLVQQIITSTNRVLKVKSIKSRLLHNIARVNTRLKNYQESISYALQGIDWCIECEDLYLMAELHYHIGYNHELLHDYEKALEYLDYSIQLFELNPDCPYLDFLQKKRSDYAAKLKKNDF